MAMCHGTPSMIIGLSSIGERLIGCDRELLPFTELVKAEQLYSTDLHRHVSRCRRMNTPL